MQFNKLRTSENAFAELFCHIMRKEVSADCMLIASGGLRSDRIYPANHYYTFGDIFDIYPLEKYLCLIEISGSDLLLAFENSVSKYPSLEGRYCQVSNIEFKFDPNRSLGSRVDPTTVKIAGEPIVSSKLYRLALD